MTELRIVGEDERIHGEDEFYLQPADVDSELKPSFSISRHNHTSRPITPVILLTVGLTRFIVQVLLKVNLYTLTELSCAKIEASHQLLSNWPYLRFKNFRCLKYNTMATIIKRLQNQFEK